MSLYHSRLQSKYAGGAGEQGLDAVQSAQQHHGPARGWGLAPGASTGGRGQVSGTAGQPGQARPAGVLRHLKFK